MTNDPALAAAVMDDWRRAPLDDRARAMLEYAVTVACDVHRVDQNYVDGLRARGLSDENVLDTAEVAGFFSMYVRLADGLGVEPEDFMPRR